MTANTRQVGGTHYRSDFQHWDFVETTGLGYVEGCATKYLARHRKKNGAQDIEKAAHYIEKLIELHDNFDRVNRGHCNTDVAMMFCRANNLESEEAVIIIRLATWETREHLAECLEATNHLLAHGAR